MYNKRQLSTPWAQDYYSTLYIRISCFQSVTIGGYYLTSAKYRIWGLTSLLRYFIRCLMNNLD